jgi:hypothetical protein
LGGALLHYGSLAIKTQLNGDVTLGI